MGLSKPFLDAISTDSVRGPLNLITDVPGVSVGQTTFNAGTHHTGALVVKLTADNIFSNKLPAAAHVINALVKVMAQFDQ